MAKDTDADKPQDVFSFRPDRKTRKPQEYSEAIKAKFAEERDLRLGYRPEGTAQFTSDLTGPLARYEQDPYADETLEREAIEDRVEVLFIGGGFSALLTSARRARSGSRASASWSAGPTSGARGIGTATPVSRATWSRTTTCPS